jgi:hypothetical protein
LSIRNFLGAWKKKEGIKIASSFDDEFSPFLSLKYERVLIGLINCKDFHVVRPFIRDYFHQAIFQNALSSSAKEQLWKWL